MRRKASTKRKTNTAMVFNPNRSVGLASRRAPARRASARKSNGRSLALRSAVNPAKKRRRSSSVRRNPIQSRSGLIVGAVMAGLGVSLFDVFTTRFLPQTSGVVRIGIKARGAWAIDSYGAKVPVLGKYRREIALVLLTSAVVDGVKLWLLPTLTQAFPSVQLLVAPNAAQANADAGLGNIYGNAPVGDYTGVYA